MEDLGLEKGSGVIAVFDRLCVDQDAGICIEGNDRS